MCTCQGLCTILTGVRTVVQSRAAKSVAATQVHVSTSASVKPRNVLMMDCCVSTFVSFTPAVFDVTKQSISVTGSQAISSCVCGKNIDTLSCSRYFKPNRDVFLTPNQGSFCA